MYKGSAKGKFFTTGDYRRHLFYYIVFFTRCQVYWNIYYRCHCLNFLNKYYTLESQINFIPLHLIELCSELIIINSLFFSGYTQLYFYWFPLIKKLIFSWQFIHQYIMIRYGRKTPLGKILLFVNSPTDFS